MNLLDLGLIKMNNYLTLENIPEEITFWNMQYYLDEHTVLHYIEIEDWTTEELDTESGTIEIDIPKRFQLSFTFFGIQYFCEIYYSDLTESNELVYPEGDYILFDSFEKHIEETHWDLIKTLCLKLTEEYEK